MTCIIVDDEPLARQGMEMLIANLPSLQLLGSFSNPLAAALPCMIGYTTIPVTSAN